MRTRKAPAILLLVLVVAAGAFGVGRLTAGRPGATEQGYPAGHADGLREGRAEEATLGRPATDKTVYESGYVAGMADAFAGYDGGWDRNAPYVIVLVPGGPGVTYRIASRTRLAPDVNYYLCPDGHTLCQQPRG